MAFTPYYLVLTWILGDNRRLRWCVTPTSPDGILMRQLTGYLSFENTLLQIITRKSLIKLRNFSTGWYLLRKTKAVAARFLSASARRRKIISHVIVRSQLSTLSPHSVRFWRICYPNFHDIHSCLLHPTKFTRRNSWEIIAQLIIVIMT